VRRVHFEVAAEELDEVLDRVIWLLPGGLLESPAGPGRVALSGVGHAATMPSRARLEEALGGAAQAYAEDDVPADWRLRRTRTDVLIGDRLVVRAPADPAPSEGLIDVVIDRGGVAFGTGSHPTTRMCLELLLDLEPAGSFADIGCGLGTLAIVAAKLGFAPVIGIDREPAAIEQSVANAARNDVAVVFTLADADTAPMRTERTLAVNAPPEVHVALAGRVRPQTERVLVSGSAGPETPQVLELYAKAGLVEARRMDDEDGVWSALLLERPEGGG